MSKRPPVLGFLTASSVLCSHFPFKTIRQSSFKELPSYDDRHFYFEGLLETSSSCQQMPYVLKLTNITFGAQLVDGTNAVMQHLTDKGIVCSRPIMSRFGHYVEMISDSELGSANDECVYPVRVLRFIPGIMLSELDGDYLTSPFLYSIGFFTGKVDAALQDFSHPSIDSYVNECWDLQHFLCLKKYMPILEDQRQREMAHTVLSLYETHLLPLLPFMKKGVIHGDMNGQNIILCTAREQYEIAGLIDFGDCVRTGYLFELAILISYMMMKRQSPVAFVAPIIRGYLDSFPLPHNELSCLYYAVLALLCTSAVKGAYNMSLQPDNKHIQRHIDCAWHLMSLLLSMSKTDIDREWSICMSMRNSSDS